MDVRARILDAALGLLARGGAAELTQPRVARAAGVRQSHLTYYFPTRDALLQAVADRSIDTLAATLMQAAQGGRLGPQRCPGRSPARSRTRDEHARCSRSSALRIATRRCASGCAASSGKRAPGSAAC